MWGYTDKINSHFIGQRKVGVVEDPDGVGEVDSPACGDALKLSLEIDIDKKVSVEEFVQELKEVRCTLEAL